MAWFSKKKDEKEKAQHIVLEEFDNIKKLLRKQAVMIEELRREQKAAAAARENRDLEPLLELCDSIFYLHRAFQTPGLMSRQHAQVLNMVMKNLERFAASQELEMILEEGAAFDSKIHEAVANRSPESEALDVVELVQPGYLHGGKVIRPARVVVGRAGENTPAQKGTSES